jgi:hypothetical protein
MLKAEACLPLTVTIAPLPRPNHWGRRCPRDPYASAPEAWRISLSSVAVGIAAGALAAIDGSNTPTEQKSRRVNALFGMGTCLIEDTNAWQLTERDVLHRLLIVMDEGVHSTNAG